jgi:ABC-2 type transport system ATP-binding protein
MTATAAAAVRDTVAACSVVPALSVVNVSHAYGAKRALDGVTFAVMPGGFTALIGLNGAGKTTLFSLITRLFDTKAGSVSILGHRIDREPGAALRRLGVVFQARTLDLDLSVMDNLLFHAALHGFGAAAARARALAALQDVNLADRSRDKARQLSGGQMRRAEIARALLHEPRLLVLDEPTVGLDIASKRTIAAHVRRLVQERGVAVLWATHLLDEIEPSDDVVVLHQGRQLAAGSVADVVAATGRPDLRSAFSCLVGDGPQC